MTTARDECQCYLFVEGQDDIHVIGQLLKDFKVSTRRKPDCRIIDKLELNLCFDEAAVPFDILQCGGVERVLRKFTAKIASSNSREVTIGIVLDNDHDEKHNRVEQVRGAIDTILRETQNRYRWKNLDLPYEILSHGGFIAEPGNADTPRIGCWLMPDHQSHGMLETFLAKLVSNHGLFDFAKHATQTARKEQQAPYKACHEDKAVMHTYLAWQDEPGKPFGTAFEQGSFDAQKDLAVSFVAWIKRLFRPKTHSQEPMSCQHPEL
ncbi:MAG: hypothetical protein FWD31_01620 [Planctomycetaceae bacterium]|nr:hypothetical protein [Planctomycetaceae bacterium]